MPLASRHIDLDPITFPQRWVQECRFIRAEEGREEEHLYNYTSTAAAPPPPPPPPPLYP